MEPDWVKAYETDNDFRAEMIKRMLADNDIQSLFIDKTDSSYPLIGDVEVYVKRDDIIKALKLIGEFNRD
jgi:hypothetical protein